MNNSLSNQSNMVFWMNGHLWDYLFRGTSKGLTRTCGKHRKHRLEKHEAYYDLLQQVCTCEEQADDSYVKVSGNALAKAWEWHRQTVNNFLEELKDLGVLSVYTESFSTFVKLNNIEEVNNSISVPSPHGERSYISEE